MVKTLSPDESDDHSPVVIARRSLRSSCPVESDKREVFSYDGGLL